MQEQPTYRDQPIPATSVAARTRHPNEVVVRFTRWTQHGMTAYQKGQHAGFLRADAERMARKGSCVIVPMAEPAVDQRTPQATAQPPQGHAQQQRRA